MKPEEQHYQAASSVERGASKAEEAVEDCEVRHSECGARGDCCIMGCDVVHVVSAPTFRRNVLSETLP